ncbi:MAG TPA: alpha-L-arabinofuranosidase, partial [Paludibacteraceae bacterium]|nr:alpha-L-arabinofuranosidase [Paludibacteraceae bacterium]
MKKHVSLFFLFIFLFCQNIVSVSASEPDSAFLFSYSTLKNDGRNGLHFAWSIDQTNWHSIGPEHRFLFSDYGRWGTEKRLVTPFLFQDNKQIWHCLWSL